MIWASKEYAKAHPEVTPARAYIMLDTALQSGPGEIPRNVRREDEAYDEVVPTEEL